MSNRSWTVEECNAAFEAQRELLEREARGSRFVPCDDMISFGGTCYDPAKIIFDDGRVWGLRSRNFIDLTNSENKRGYKIVNTSATAKLINPETGMKYNPHKTMTIHKLVANYFCDKLLIDIMREVNSKQGEDIFNLNINSDGNYEDITVHHKDSNKHNNRADNLQYVYNKVHDLLTALHNNDSMDEKTRGIAIGKLKAAGFDNPEDNLLKIMLNNASLEGTELYGIVVKDDSNPRGFHMEIKMESKIQTDPNYKDTEEDIIKMLVATSGTPIARG